MQKKALLIPILIIFCLSAFSQSSGYYCSCKNNQAQELSFKPKLRGEVFVNEFPRNDIQYFRDWTRGKVILSDSTVVEKQHLRYNRYHDQLLWFRPKDSKIMVVDKSMLAGFELIFDEREDTARFIKKKFTPWHTKDTTNVFFQVLVEKGIELYVLRDIKYIAHNNELHLKNRYVLYKDGSYHKFKPNRWSLYRLFREDKSQWFIFQLFTDKNIGKMRRIIRSHHLKIKKERDLIRAIRLYTAGFSAND
ncbi:MAG: hypothetical protein K9H65_01510 [Bacteroidales bacterium]|nr:hypothetical protein [Bacteroidales bacterium]